MILKKNSECDLVYSLEQVIYSWYPKRGAINAKWSYLPTFKENNNLYLIITKKLRS